MNVSFGLGELSLQIGQALLHICLCPLQSADLVIARLEVILRLFQLSFEYANSPSQFKNNRFVR